MCGRYTIRHPQRLDPALFGVDVIPMDAPRYNIAPGQEVLVVRSVRGTRAARMATWGLIPGWARDPAIGYKLANARGETLAEKPSFRVAWHARRALLPADGYYEWQAIAGAKQKQSTWARVRAVAVGFTAASVRRVSCGASRRSAKWKQHHRLGAPAIGAIELGNLMLEMIVEQDVVRLALGVQLAEVQVGQSRAPRCRERAQALALFGGIPRIVAPIDRL